MYTLAPESSRHIRVNRPDGTQIGTASRELDHWVAYRNSDTPHMQDYIGKFDTPEACADAMLTHP